MAKLLIRVGAELFDHSANTSVSERIQMQDLSAGIVASGIDAMPAEVAILDSEGEIILVNEAWRKFADENQGIDPDYWLGENYLEISEQAYEEPQAAEAIDGLRSILNGTTDHIHVEYPCHSPSEHRWFMMEAAGFRHNGEQYILISHHNITDRKLAEMQTKAQKEQLETLLGVLTHDIRNPLNVIDGYAEMLATELEETEKIDTIRRAAQRITEISEATLAFTRTGGLSEVEPLEVSELAREAWQTVATADARLRIRDSQKVLGDQRLLLQLFENLFRNAIEHAGDECTVTVGSLPTGFYVEDDGEGIPQVVREKALEWDFSTSGTGGVGLSIVQAVVRAHDGQLTITDTVSGGARFEIMDLEVPPK